MIQSLQLLGNRILIREEPVKENADGRILIIGKNKKAPLIGIVVKAGPGIYSEKGEFIPNTVTQGDRVMFQDWDGDVVEFGLEKFYMITETHVIGVLK